MSALAHKEDERNREHGFTMAELLIVVAIVAVLVAIAVPVFSAQLEKSREAVDLANTRSAYAVLQATRVEGTNPDGTPINDTGGLLFYVYTGSGFVNKTSPSYRVDDVLVLKSSADFSLLSDYVISFSEYTNHASADPLPTLEGHALVVTRPINSGDPVFVLWPASWLT